MLVTGPSRLRGRFLSVKNGDRFTRKVLSRTQRFPGHVSLEAYNKIYYIFKKWPQNIQQKSLRCKRVL